MSLLDKINVKVVFNKPIDDSMYFLVTFKYEGDFKLKWFIGDDDIYSIEFYNNLLAAMEEGKPCSESGGGNSGSSIDFTKDNTLKIYVNCGGSGADQSASLTLNKEDGMKLIAEIIRIHDEEKIKFMSSIKE